MSTSCSFLFFLSDGRKTYSATTTSHRKLLIGMLNKKSIGVIIKYNMVKYWWLCRTVYMYISTIPYFSYVPMLINYSWSGWQCTCAWQIDVQWSLWHWQALYLSINIQCSTTRIKNIWFEDYNKFLNTQKMISVRINNSKISVWGAS